jgi:hypothetical protein
MRRVVVERVRGRRLEVRVGVATAVVDRDGEGPAPVPRRRPLGRMRACQPLAAASMTSATSTIAPPRWAERMPAWTAASALTASSTPTSTCA